MQALADAGGTSYSGQWTPAAAPGFVDNVGVVTVEVSDAFTAVGDTAASAAAIVPYGSALQVGLHELQMTATDAAGLSYVCRFMIKVGASDGTDDNGIGPVVLCPDDMFVATTPGEAYYDGGWTAAVATDNAGPAIASTTTPLTQQFAIGAHVVSYSSTDASYATPTPHATVTCAFTIVATDTEVPTISSCGGPAAGTLQPQNGDGGSRFTVDLDAATDGMFDRYVGGWGAPTVDDNVGVASVTYVAFDTANERAHTVDDALTIGEYAVVYTATDAAGNFATCSYFMDIVDTQAPLVDCDVLLPPDQRIFGSDASKAYWTGTFNVAAVGAARDVSLATRRVTYNGGDASGFRFAVATATYTVTFVATDAAARTTSCTFRVLVVDFEAPTSDVADGSVLDAVVTDAVSNPGTAYAAGWTDVGAVYTGGWAAPQFSDNVGVASTVVRLSNAAVGIVDLLLPAGSGAGSTSLPVGVNVVTFTVLDARGNVLTTSLSITVYDAVPPVLTCSPPTMTVALPSTNTVTDGVGAVSSVSPNDAGSPISVSARDNVDGDTALSVLTAAHNEQQLGTELSPYEFTYQHADAAGNDATFCVVRVNAVDNTPPVILPIADIVLQTTSWGAVASWRVDVVDNGPHTITTEDLSTRPVVSAATTFPIGVTTVVVTVDDGTHTVSALFKITVQDNGAPNIICPDDYTVSFNGGAGGVFQFVNHGPLTIVDNNPGFQRSLTVSAINDAGNLLVDAKQLQIGANTITYTVSDADSPQAIGLTDACTFTITVVDARAPVYNDCTDTTTFYSMVGGVRSTTFTFPQPWWTDNRDLSSQLTFADNTAQPLVAGENTMTFTATDRAGNSATCSYIVILVDKAPPEITCPPKLTTLALPSNAVTAAFTYAISAADDLDPTGGVLTSTGDFALGSELSNPTTGTANLARGLTGFRVSATDASGNAASCSWYVRVVDTQAPQLRADYACPSDIIVRTIDVEHPDRIQLSFPTDAQVTAGFPKDPTDAFIDNLGELEPMYAIFKVTNGSNVFHAGVNTVALVVGDSSSNYVDVDGVVVEAGVRTSVAAENCRFQVTVLRAYPGVPIDREAYLSKVYMKQIDFVTSQYGAYIEVVTLLPWPHRLRDSLRVNNGTAVSPVEAFTDCPLPPDGSNAATCLQHFGTTVLFPPGCSLNKQEFTFRLTTQCTTLDCDPAVYPDKFFDIVITLSAKNFCSTKLSDVVVTASIKPVTTNTLAAYESVHVAGSPTNVIVNDLFYNGDRIVGLVEVKSESVLLESVTILDATRTYWTDEAHTALASDGSANPLTLVGGGGDNNAATVEIGDVKAGDYAVFSFQPNIPVDTTYYAQLDATLELGYRLGGVADDTTTTTPTTPSSPRRLLRKVIKVSQAMPTRRKLLQDGDEDGSDDKSRVGSKGTSTRILAVNLALAAANSLVTSEGGAPPAVGVAMGRVLYPTSGVTINQVLTTLETAFALAMPDNVQGVEVRAIRSDGTGLCVQRQSLTSQVSLCLAVLVAVSHKVTHTAVVRQLVTSSGSALHTSLIDGASQSQAPGDEDTSSSASASKADLAIAVAAAAMVTGVSIDHTFYYAGAINPKYVAISSPGEDGDNTGTTVGVVVGLLIAAAIAAYALLHYKRRRDASKASSDDAKSAASSRNTSRRNSVNSVASVEGECVPTLAAKVRGALVCFGGNDDNDDNDDGSRSRRGSGSVAGGGNGGGGGDGGGFVGRWQKKRAARKASRADDDDARRARSQTHSRGSNSMEALKSGGAVLHRERRASLGNMSNHSDMAQQRGPSMMQSREASRVNSRERNGNDDEKEDDNVSHTLHGSVASIGRDGSMTYIDRQNASFHHSHHSAMNQSPERGGHISGRGGISLDTVGISENMFGVEFVVAPDPKSMFTPRRSAADYNNADRANAAARGGGGGGDANLSFSARMAARAREDEKPRLNRTGSSSSKRSVNRQGSYSSKRSVDRQSSYKSTDSENEMKTAMPEPCGDLDMFDLDQLEPEKKTTRRQRRSKNGSKNASRTSKRLKSKRNAARRSPVSVDTLRGMSDRTSGQGQQQPEPHAPIVSKSSASRWKLVKDDINRGGRGNGGGGGGGAYTQRMNAHAQMRAPIPDDDDGFLDDDIPVQTWPVNGPDFDQGHNNNDNNNKNNNAAAFNGAPVVTQRRASNPTSTRRASTSSLPDMLASSGGASGGDGNANAQPLRQRALATHASDVAATRAPAAARQPGRRSTMGAGQFVMPSLGAQTNLAQFSHMAHFDDSSDDDDVEVEVLHM
jgi:hypothetical protein